MNLSAQELVDFAIPDATQTLNARDTILYALSVGYGSEPLDEDHLRHIQEKNLIGTPTLANIAAHHGPWMKAAGVNWDRVVHAEHRLTLHHPMLLDVPLVSRARCLSVVDRGEAKGMFAAFERSIFTVDGDAPIATIVQTNGCLGDGGCGSAGTAPAPLPAPPKRAADFLFHVDIPENAAALYRLNGDLNPLHIDPATATRAGFRRPILHGLCTFGYAGYAIGRALAVDGLRELGSIAARFSAPVFPGDTLVIHIWQDGADIQFRGFVPARNAIILDNGTATLI